MARSRTVATLVTLGQQRANRESDGSIVASEWKSWLSSVYGQLHGKVADTGCRYFETEATLTLPSPVTLPTDHYCTLGVERVIDSAGRRCPLREAAVQERARLLGRTGEATRYAIRGTTVELYPAPSTGTYKLLYTPQPTDLATASDSVSVDLLTADGEEFVLWGMALLAWSKGEDDVRLADAKQKEALAAVLAWAGQLTFTTSNRHILDPGDDPHYGWP
jgi:hypothetical protein